MHVNTVIISVTVPKRSDVCNDLYAHRDLKVSRGRGVPFTSVARRLDYCALRWSTSWRWYPGRTTIISKEKYKYFYNKINPERARKEDEAERKKCALVLL